jgi:hypothetical protein
VDLGKAFRRGGARGQWTGPVTLPELERLTNDLCALIDREKHRKATTQLVAWINEVADVGGAELMDYLVHNLAYNCVDYGVPASAMDNRVPQVTGVPMTMLLKATLRAQTVIVQATDRFRAGEPTALPLEERELVWESYELAVLCIYYFLQCLVGCSHFTRFTEVLYAQEQEQVGIPDDVPQDRVPDTRDQ